MPNLWGCFKDLVIGACSEVCGKKRGLRSKGDTWWWNEEVKEVVLQMKAHREMCQNSIVENKWRYKDMKNKTCKAVSIAMSEKVEDVLAELQNFPNGMFRLVKGLKTIIMKVEGGRCMKEEMESCVSVRRKVVKSGRIIWNGS